MDSPLSVCLVSLFAGAKDWTLYTRNQNKDPFFRYHSTNIIFLASQMWKSITRKFWKFWKSLIFCSLWPKWRDLDQHSERTCVSSKQCIFVISSQRYYDKYPACLHPTRVEGLFTGKCRCILYKHGWGLREQWCANSLESLLTGVLSRPSLLCAPPCLPSTSISTSIQK